MGEGGRRVGFDNSSKILNVWLGFDGSLFFRMEWNRYSLFRE